MKFWAVGGREDRDRMLSLKGLPHLISPICCPDPAEKWLLVLVSTSDPAKIPHASGVSFSNVSAPGSLPQLYCCSLQQMSFLWWGLEKKGKEWGGQWGEKWRVHLCAGAGQGWILLPGSHFHGHESTVLPQLVPLPLLLSAPMSSWKGRSVCYQWC